MVMLSSQILAWVSALLCLAEALRYPARVSKVKALNKAFHRIHIPLGVLLLATALMHGLLAGNSPRAGLGEMELAPVLFTLNWGTACFMAALLLAVSYLLRKALKKRWMAAHRVLTVLMIALLALHLTDVGIRLPDRWAGPPAVESPAPTPAPTDRKSVV